MKNWVILAVAVIAAGYWMLNDNPAAALLALIVVVLEMNILSLEEHAKLRQELMDRQLDVMAAQDALLMEAYTTEGERHDGQANKKSDRNDIDTYCA